MTLTVSFQFLCSWFKLLSSSDSIRWANVRHLKLSRHRLLSCEDNSAQQQNSSSLLVVHRIAKDIVLHLFAHQIHESLKQIKSRRKDEKEKQIFLFLCLPVTCSCWLQATSKHTHTHTVSNETDKRWNKGNTLTEYSWFDESFESRKEMQFSILYANFIEVKPHCMVKIADKTFHRIKINWLDQNKLFCFTTQNEHTDDREQKPTISRTDKKQTSE